MENCVHCGHYVQPLSDEEYHQKHGEGICTCDCEGLYLHQHKPDEVAEEDLCNFCKWQKKIGVTYV